MGRRHTFAIGTCAMRPALLGFFVLTASQVGGDAYSREGIRAPLSGTGGAWSWTSKSGTILRSAAGVRGDGIDAGRGSKPPLSHNVDCSEWYDMRVQLNRAMGQLQSEAQQPSAIETARDLNCWLMHMLSQPELSSNSTEHRALLTNLRRISQLQKDNLRLRLEKVMNEPSRRSRGGDVGEMSERGAVMPEASGDVARWSAADATQHQQGQGVHDWKQHQRPARQPHNLQAQQSVQPPLNAQYGGQAARPGMQARYHTARPIIGRSGVYMDEYTFHRRGPNPSARSAGPGFGATPQPRPYHSEDSGASAAAAGCVPGGWQADAARRHESDSDEFDLDGAIQRLQEVRELNRQLSRQVSRLANDNIRLKSVLNQAQSWLLADAVAQVSSRAVATERAVPSIVKAASTWHARSSGGRVGAAAGGVGEWGCMLEEGSDAAERGLVMASAALLKRLGLRVGQHVLLKRHTSHDRLGANVNSTGGAFLGIMVGEGGEGTEGAEASDAIVYLHMDDGQVRQFALSEVQTERLITPADEQGGMMMRGASSIGNLALAAAAAAAAREREFKREGGSDDARNDAGDAKRPVGPEAGVEMSSSASQLRDSRKMLSGDLESSKCSAPVLG